MEHSRNLGVAVVVAAGGSSPPTSGGFYGGALPLSEIASAIVVLGP